MRGGSSRRWCSWDCRLSLLLDVGSVPGRALSLGALPVAVLLAGTFWRCHPQLVRSEAGLVAGVAAVFAGTLHSLGAGRVPADLLLLSRRLLQSVLGRPAFLHRERAAQGVSRRGFLSAHHAKHSPILFVCGAALSGFPRPRCLESDVVYRR